MTTQSGQTQTTTPASGDAKWWGHSMTIWGVIITSLSTVLPTIGPLHGLNITADLVHQIGDQLVQVVQALRPRRHGLDHLRPHARHNLAGAAANNPEYVIGRALLAEPAKRPV